MDRARPGAQSSGVTTFYTWRQAWVRRVTQLVHGQFLGETARLGEMRGVVIRAAMNKVCC
ncbi:hypothetical protein GCM10011610_70630 [Nocardia rhizosphaerihabitans]|uniref:Uncharacterized protein n=1 Tax=Nocardia rhizosphaerihabitans TaxID=1691570 RepID=A0ABQ2L393_9NOCA|nr:hypothetical protein GCM10011610_70630 [Nocardia rhizosphaerihabitans]